MEKKFITLSETEQEDFNTECRDYGVDPNEFQLTEYDYVETPINNSTFFPNAKLTITRGGTSQTYLTGHATHWVADFAEDLRNGIFNIIKSG